MTNRTLGPVIVGVILLVIVIGFVMGRTGPTTAPPAPATTAASLADRMSVDVTGCTQDGARGKVTNNASVTVDLYIQTNYLASDGQVLDDGIDDIRGLRPGETGLWDAPYLGHAHVSKCRASVSSAFAQ